MRACIHRGASEVGGTVVELAADGRRVVLEAGLPLDLDRVAARDLLPDVPGLWAEGDGSLLGLLISHGHPDHYGLADLAAPSVPIYIGEAAAAILREAAFFVPSTHALAVSGYLRHRERLELGPFSVTPWLVDHSGFDAYALLVEADGRRLLYTGDIRAHGRKPVTLETLAREAGHVDVLLIEGTRVGDDRRPQRSEADVERACAERFSASDGMALAFYSPQNVDRLVTLYRAARRAGRVFVMDLYSAAVTAATRRQTIPQAGWEDVRVYLPRAQRQRVIAGAEFERTDAIREKRIYAEELAERSDDLVMTCRGSMLAELRSAGCLRGATAIWSMWPGYLREPSGERTLAELEALAIPVVIEHASGHASRDDLVRFAKRVAAGSVVPIHTAAPGRFPETFPRATVHRDDEWWQV